MKISDHHKKISDSGFTLFVAMGPTHWMLKALFDKKEDFNERSVHYQQYRHWVLTPGTWVRG